MEVNLTPSWRKLHPAPIVLDAKRLAQHIVHKRPCSFHEKVINKQRVSSCCLLHGRKVIVIEELCHVFITSVTFHLSQSTPQVWPPVLCTGKSNEKCRRASSSRNVMLNPTLEFLCLCSPVIITSFYIPCVVTKHLNVAIITINQLIFKLFKCGGVLTQELSTGEKIAPLAVVLVTFNAVEDKEREHLIPEKTPIIIMEEVPTPLFWVVVSSLDVVQIANASRK